MSVRLPQPDQLTDYVDLLDRVHSTLRPRVYVEVGIECQTNTAERSRTSNSVASVPTQQGPMAAIRTNVPPTDSREHSLAPQQRSSNRRRSGSAFSNDSAVELISFRPPPAPWKWQRPVTRPCRNSVGFETPSLDVGPCRHAIA